jgi:23S rRNA (guanosine2251-2'-O)-methyltransferase
VVALVSAAPYTPLAALVERAAARENGLLVLLDGLTDPRNVGAAIRSCAAAGADGVVLHAERTAGLTPGAAKASAGTLERLPVARTPAPRALAEQLLGLGFRVLVLDAAAGTAWTSADYRGRLLVVAGSEEKGPGRWIRDVDAAGVAIPLSERVESLNVSVALGIVLFEAVRQRAGG